MSDWPLSVLAVAIGAGACIISAAGSGFFRLLALRCNLVDAPDGRLKRQQAPVPLLGGAAVWVAFAVAALGPVRACTPEAERIPLWGVFAGATLMLLVGVVDDLRRLGWGEKLLIELVLAFVLAKAGVRIEIMWFPDWVNWTASALWLVGIANAANLIDVMDGLAAGVFGVASTAFCAVGVLTRDAPVALSAAALAGALLGFLWWNWTPARIYLGDAGSLLVGFILSAVAMWGDYTAKNDAALGVPLLVLGVPLFEMGFLVVRRFRAGRSPFRGSTDHFALRLRHAGWDVPRIVLTAMALSALLGVMGILAMRNSIEGAFAMYATAAAIGLYAWKALSALPAPPEGKP